MHTLTHSLTQSLHGAEFFLNNQQMLLKMFPVLGSLQVHLFVPNSYFIFDCGLGVSAWGAQAGIYLLFYTLLASLPLLVGILFVYNSLELLCLFLLSGNGSLVGGLFYACMAFTFLVRMPIFIVHLWLPRAHVEAPVSLSQMCWMST